MMNKFVYDKIKKPPTGGFFIFNFTYFAFKSQALAPFLVSIS